jgi:large repetitive protein
MPRTEEKAQHVFGFLLLLGFVLATGLLLTQPAQAQTNHDVSTTQTVHPKPATVGQPLTLTVTVTNNSVPQHVGLKDFFPHDMELVSATPSQGSCGSGHRHNAVECALGELRSGGSATVEIVLLPTVPGISTNRALGGGKHSPENPDDATITVNPAAG